jgi:6-pyruvoyltetrahydropterin/6-carboxytetrahydropterin synthase
MTDFAIQVDHATDTAHRIVGHKGKCAMLHGHTYQWKVMCWSDELTSEGFVVDFGDIKDILNGWDHRTLLWDKDPLRITEMHPNASDLGPLAVSLAHPGVYYVQFNPTAENMAAWMADRILKEFPSLTRCVVSLKETPKTLVEVEGKR